MRYNPDILVKIAIADAFGVAVEYVDPGHPNYELALQFDHYYPHPRWKMGSKVGVGRYTDDTAMSIGTAEVILAGPPYRKDNFTKAFFDCFKRDPRKGYSSGFQSLLEKCKTWEELKETLIPNSDKNGAAMRSVPIGVLNDPDLVCEVARMQAEITHNTPGGILSSQIVALASHYAIYNDEPLERDALLDWMSPYLPNGLANLLKTPWKGPVVGPEVGLKTAHAVIDIVTTQKSLLDVLRRTIYYGGDTDSVASIAMGIASSRMNDVLPPYMEWELETGRLYGVSFLRELGTKLFDKFYYGK